MVMRWLLRRARGGMVSRYLAPLDAVAVLVAPAGRRESNCAAELSSSRGRGCVTVIWALPTLPSTVAEIVAVPAVTAVTVPNADTVATEGALVLHCAGLPVTALPSAL